MYTRYVSDPIGALLAAVLVRIGGTPNRISMLSGLLQAGASIWLATRGSSTIAFGEVVVVGVAWQLAYGLDCADGQVARAHERTSRYGAWLDQMVDLVGKSFVVGAVMSVALPPLDLPEQAIPATTAFVLAGLILLQIALAQKSSTIGKLSAERRPSRLLRVGAYAIQVTDYGLYLAVTAALLFVPQAEILWQLTIGAINIAAVVAIGFALRLGSDEP